MARFHQLAAAALAAFAALTTNSSADHIPGHDDGDAVFPVPIPGQDHFSGGAMWVTAIGPNGGSQILNTRFDITFVSDGATPASELLLNVGLWIDNGNDIVQAETVLTGADLGFGAGPGTFHGTWETDDLNGIAVESFFFPPYSIVDIIVGATNGGIDGTAYFVDSYIYFDIIPVPAPGSLALAGLAGAALRRRR